MVAILKETMKLTRVLFYLLSLLFAVVLSWPFSTSADQAQYFYDELGRLVGVIDGQGNIASYEYDAVGNLLSISRNPVVVPSITGVSPDPVEAGASVPITISGTGLLLSAVTISNPDIQVGLIDSNTGTMLDTTVTIPNPTTFGATTITVTVPGGTDNVTFTVNQPIPIITQLSATVLPPGSTVAIDGAGFATEPGSNQVTFPGQSGARLPATVLSENFSSLTVQVPTGTTSGDVTVQVGTLTSAGVFFTTPGITVIPVTATVGIPTDPVLASANALQNIQLVGQGFVAGDTMDIPAIDQNGVFSTVLASLTNVSPDGTTANMVVPALATTGLWALSGSTLAGVPVQIIPTTSSIDGTVTIGAPVDVLGGGFQEGATTVLFPGAVGPVVASDVLFSNDRLTVTVPPGVTGGTLTVMTPGGTSNGASVGIAVLVAINSVAQSGTPFDSNLPSVNCCPSISIEGLGFEPGLDLLFTTTDHEGVQGTEFESITNVSADGTTARAFPPITVTTGLAALGTGSVFLQIVPKLSAIEDLGSNIFEPGTDILLNGSGFKEGATTALFEGAPDPVPTSTLVGFNTRLRVTIPNGVTLVPPGNKTVITVTSDGGTSRTLPVSHPLLVGSSDVAPEGTPQVPTDPSAIIGQVVTLTGSGFTTNTRIVNKEFNSTGSIITRLKLPLSVSPDGTSLTLQVPIRTITNVLTVQDKNLLLGSGTLPLQILPTINTNATGTLDPGSQLQLSGTGFDLTSTQVQFSGVATPVPADSAEIIASAGTSTFVTVPSGVDPNGVLFIITPGGQSDPFDLTLLGGGNTEIEPNDTPATATVITGVLANGDPVTIDGVFNPSGDLDFYRLEVTEAPLGPFYHGAITLKGAQGPNLNVLFTVLAPDETTVVFTAQGTIDAVTPLEFDFFPTVNGPHYLKLEETTSQGSVTHEYQLTIQENLLL